MVENRRGKADPSVRYVEQPTYCKYFANACDSKDGILIRSFTRLFLVLESIVLTPYNSIAIHDVSSHPHLRGIENRLKLHG